MDAEAYYIVAESAQPDKVTFVPFSQVYKYLSITKAGQIIVSITFENYTTSNNIYLYCYL